MSKNNGNGFPPVLGAEEIENKVSQLPPPTIEEVRKYLKADLQMCIMLLDSVYKDQATCEALADYLHGRFMNHRHKKELESQEELKFK